MELTQKALEELIAKEVGAKVADIQEQMRADQEKAAKEREVAAKSEAAAALARPAPSEERKAATRSEFGALIRAAVGGKGDPERASARAKKIGASERVIKAFGANSGAQGGYLLAPEISADVIDLLYSSSYMRKLGCAEIDLMGTFTQPYLSAGPTASYVGEHAVIAASTPTVGQMSLSEKKLAALVPISNDLLKQSGDRANTLVAQMCEGKINEAKELAFFRGTGSSSAPKGVYHWSNGVSQVALETNTATTNNGSTTAEITANIAQRVRALLDSKVPLLNVSWVMTTKTWTRLVADTNSYGVRSFPEVKDDSKLFGFPIFIHNGLPNNLSPSGGVASNSSELYLGAWGNVLIGLGRQMELVVGEGAYHDGTSLVSAFAQDQQLVRVIDTHDFGCMYGGKEVTVLNNSWGA